jgi:hypothetical protein
VRRSLPLVALAAALAAAYRRFVDPWQRRWGATDAELAAALPGDELIAAPAGQITRAIGVAAPPETVWPWVIQIGADRGGFYSYDWLENLFRLGIHSAERIIPEWQERAVGDLVHADAAGGNGWYVMDVRPPHALVLEMANVREGRPFRREETPFMEFTWAFVLTAADDGGTRLLVRERVAFGSALARALLGPVGLVSFAMTRKMLCGIRGRAEGER